jgi:hypothetical protein
VKPIVVPKDLWEQTWAGLRDRGRGNHETACVWGGRRSVAADTAQSVTFLDDLPGVRAGARYHHLSRATIDALFSILRTRREMIVADIHTHPKDWVDLSDTDAMHPIEFRPGLPAMVIPHFAQSPPTLNGLGLHEYVGDGVWRMLHPGEVLNVLRIGT